jgi:hypothetical protein
MLLTTLKLLIIGKAVQKGKQTYVKSQVNYAKNWTKQTQIRCGEKEVYSQLSLGLLNSIYTSTSPDISNFFISKL